MVAHPLRCLPGCTICLDGCDTGALSLPNRDQFHTTLEKARANGPSSRTPRPLP
jgi:ferredoxin